MLFLTRTPLSVPALMGAIMSVGVATSNSILIISFANQRFSETKDAIRAALEAGATRLRPVLMTATAMMIGMVPMALGLGEGGEQNAPLGRCNRRPAFRHNGHSVLRSYRVCHDALLEIIPWPDG